MNDNRERISLLEQQVESLKEEKRAILDAIELAANMCNFQIILNKIEDPIPIMEKTTARIRQIIHFKALSFFRASKEDEDFYQEYTDPADFSSYFTREVKQLIEDNNFSHALRKNKPLVVSSLDHQDQIILHSMNTSSRIWGMFIGVLASSSAEITDLSLFLFSITIIACSHALESFELYRQIGDKNKKLNENIHKVEEARRALQEEEEKYRALFEQATCSIILYDVESRKAVEFNDTAYQSLGYTREEFEELRIENYELDKSEKEIQIRMQKFCMEEQSSFETQHRRKDGEIRDILVNNRCIHIHGKDFLLSLLTDITEQKRNEAERVLLEKQLRQAQKIESIGTLAGGIAHDFNNILAIIMGYAELSLLDIPQSKSMERVHSNLSQLILAATRAKKLVSQILTFSRKGEETLRPIVVNSIINESLGMLRSTIPTTIEIQRHIEDEPLLILGDGTQVHQVMVNLCTNAAQAIGGKPGVITVEVKRFDWDAEHMDILDIRIEQILKSGSYVQITVSDTGHGMEPDLLERVFDPYFSTKEPGQGTGLGLAVVRGIVRNYGGYITLNSKPGEGTLVYILIPLLDPYEYPEMEPGETIFLDEDTIVL
jgi:PAS domain S-box-containing protein